MGQLHGKALYSNAAIPFLNLSEKDVNKCWEAFNDIAEGFGINKTEMIDICTSLQETFEIKIKSEMERLTGLLFDTMDTDENGLVDALEFLGALSLLSAMTIPQKITFVYNCYDFNECGEITIDELTLAMKSTLTGLCKLSLQRTCPTELVLEEIAMFAFRKAGKHPDKSITLPEFIKYCETTPEVNTWVYFFDAPNDISDEYDLHDSDIEKEIQIPIYTEIEAMNIDADISNESIYQYISNDEPQFTQPWQNTVANAAPSSIPENSIPLPSLTLDWIYGMNSSLRQCIDYVSTNEIIYPAASVLVLYDHVEHKQRYCQYHTDMVLSIAVHPQKKIIASGERGSHPRICIWHVETLDLQCTLRHFHSVGVTHVAWMPGECTLLSLGNDIFHSIAIYQWPTAACTGMPQLIFTQRTSRYHVLALQPISSGLFVTCGERHVNFWYQESMESSPGLTYQAKPGVLGKKAKMQTILSAAPISEKLILTGSVRGEIWLWDGRNVIKVLFAHSASVNVLHVFPGGVVSGGKDGKIRLWSKRMEPGASFDVLALGSFLGRVRSAVTNPDSTKLLISTGGAEIYELSTSDGCNLHYGPLVMGHCSQKLGGLSAHPTNHEMCSVGDDQSIRIWDLAHHRNLRVVRLETSARCCVYTTDGKSIAVGYGTENETEKPHLCGSFVILNEQNLAVKYQGKDSKRFLSNIKFSADGTTLAICSENIIYMYNTDDWASKGKCRSKDPNVTFLYFDLSTNGEWLQVATSKHEILYYDTNSSVENTRVGALKDVSWATCTCIYGWAVQGIWTNKKNQVVALNRNHGSSIIITADQYGHLRLYKYPSLPTSNLSYEYHGHCGRISHVEFSMDDQYVVTAGEEDCCLFQWRLELEVNEPTPPEFEYHTTSDDEIELLPPMERSPFEEASNVGEFAMETISQQDQNIDDPVKPWVGSCIPPTTAASEPDTTLSPEQLEIDWVYGYRCHDSRNNLKYTKQGKIIYPSAKIVILFDAKGWSQKHFKEHQDEVLCLATHPNQDYIASGETGKFPAVHIWHASSLKVLSTLRGIQRRGIVEVAFNPNGNLLATAGCDQDNTIVLYDWELNVALSHIKTGSSKLFGFEFHPNTSTFLALTKQTILFFSIQGRNIVCKHALMGKRGFLQPFLSVIYLNQDAIVGSTSGELYKFKGIELITIVPAHTRNVAALSVNGNSFCSGGRDGIVKLWSSELECLAEWNSCNQMPIRSLMWQNQSILVGTRDASIMELSASDGSIQFSFEMHSKGEIHGLAVHPVKDKIITCGDDGTLRIWDLYRHKCLLKFTLETASRAVSYSPEGGYIAVGLGGNIKKNRHKKDGTLLIYEEKINDGKIYLELLHETRDTKQPISVLLYSPDGISLVVGAQDNSIYIYDVPNEYAKRATFTKHKSFITHIDISSDSQYLRSNCGGYELLFADLTTGSHVASATALKNQRWHNCNTIFNWYNQGTWPHVSKHTEITASTTNNTSLIVGDTKGILKIFRFPCIRDGLPCKTYSGHVGNIKTILFSQNRNYLLSIGLTDHSLIQWKITNTIQIEKEIINHAKLIEPDPDLETEGWFLSTPLPTASFGGAKPYLSSLIPPTNPPDEPQSFPFDLELEYIYGTRLQDVRGTLGYTKSKRLVMLAGKIGISYDRKYHTQEFYSGHTASIVSMAISTDGLFVATGEEVFTSNTIRQPRIHIWDPSACTSIKILPPFHQRAIVYLKFNETNQKLISIGKDFYHSMCIYTSPSGYWYDGRILATCKTTHLPVRFLTSISNSIHDTITGGVDHIIFWRIDPPFCHGTFGSFNNHGQIQMLTCAGALDNGIILTGTRTGHFYLWNTDTCRIEKSIPAHGSSITSISISNLGVVSGSSDGHLKVWSRTLTPIWDYDMIQSKPACSNPIIRSIAWDIYESRFVVGTKGGEIYELSQERGDTSLILESHSEYGLYGLSTHPNKSNIVVTGGEDCVVRIWDTSIHEIIGKILLDTPIKCIHYSNDGKLLAVGLGSTSSQSTQLKDGAFCIIDTNTMEIIHEGRDSKQSLSDIKFSPDGTMIAIGSHDNCIYIHSVMENYTLKSKCTKATGHITHIDFSKDSKYIRATSDAYELIYLNTLDGTWISSPSLLRDVEWYSYTCVFTWATQGIWNDSNDFIHSIGIAPIKKLLITGTDNGKLNCYSFPSISKNVIYKTKYGHGGPIHGVLFNCNETKLFTIGGIDRTLFQWTII